MRPDGRSPTDLRPIHVEIGVNRYAEGSCLLSMGHTRVLCTASVSESLPRWLRDLDQGWITAEYRMLPRSTHTRRAREGTPPGGRTAEIQRLVARALRAAVDLEALGRVQVTIDCDVLQADGGTRTASINGGFLALALALDRIVPEGAPSPLRHVVSAISLGVVDGEPRVDLDYVEDSRAAFDCNVVATESGSLVEVQGTAEDGPIAAATFHHLVDLAVDGCREVAAILRRHAPARILPPEPA